MDEDKTGIAEPQWLSDVVFGRIQLPLLPEALDRYEAILGDRLCNCTTKAGTLGVLKCADAPWLCPRLPGVAHDDPRY